MPLHCEINLQHPASGVTFDNCYISGFVKFTVEEPTKVSGVSVEALGKGHCYWRETTGTGDNSRTDTYYNHEKYLNGVTHLMHAPYGQQQMVIEPGIYNYPFNFYIPAGIPSSFEHIGAYVRYKLQVRFCRPWKRDFRFVRRFNVYSRIDLNLNPALRNPAIGGLKKKFYTLIVKRGELDIEVETVASGFVPGQVIPLHCAYRNDSSVKIRYIKFSLTQFITYTATIGRVKYLPPITVASSVVSTPPKQNQSVFDIQLVIPPTVRTTMYTSKIISVFYQLVVKVKVSARHISPKVNLPLVIGTIPLHNNPGASAPMQPSFDPMQPSFDPMQPVASFDLMQPAPGFGPTQPVPGFPDSPPSYSQATQERHESSDDENSGEKK